MSCMTTRSKTPDESASRTRCPVLVFAFENSAKRAPQRVMETTSASKMDASVRGISLAEVRLLPTMSIECMRNLSGGNHIKGERGYRSSCDWHKRAVECAAECKGG